MKDRTLKNQKKQINKTLKQFRLAKRLIQLSITGTVSVITASLSFYFLPRLFFPGHKRRTIRYFLCTDCQWPEIS